MAIPYNIKSMLPGRVSVKSELLRYVSVSEDTITEYILENYNVSEARANKKTGTLTIEYSPEQFDPRELFKALDNTSPDQILESLTILENGRGQKK
jgi:Cu2+-exporting ATPase